MNFILVMAKNLQSPCPVANIKKWKVGDIEACD
jgi:hypothetical protein